MPSRQPAAVLGILFATLAAIASASAQATTSSANSAVPSDDSIVLSPFEVNADSDVGYVATSTLAGTRFKSELRDTAASISVLTSEFLSDIGANTLSDALKYSVNAQLNVGDDSSSSASPNGNNQQGGPPQFRVRGQPSTQARNYFSLILDTNTYNLERIEDARGPNSVLFGFGSPGGILNLSTKQARTDRNFRKATVDAGSFGSQRNTLDLNHVLLRGKLAFRLNAVYDQAYTSQEYAFRRDRRFDLAVKYQVTPTMQIRAEFEHMLYKENKSRPFAMLDGGVQRWMALGSPTFPTAIASNAAFNVTRLNATTRRLIYIGNDNTLIESRNTLVTTDPGTTAITNRDLAGATINYGGPGQLNDVTANDFSVFLEKQFGKRTFVELAFNHQDRDRELINPSQTNGKIWGDPNQFLPAGRANPYVGMMFMENSSAAWERNLNTDSSNDLRGTVSHELDAGKWGNYRLAVMGEYIRVGGQSFSQREAWAGRPFDVTPENNQVRRRNYVTPGVWSTFFFNSPLTTGLLTGVIDPVTGQTLNSTWVPRSQSQQDDPSNQKTGLVSGQARYFDGRLVFGAGYRYDKLHILDRTAQRDPVTNEWSLAYATEVEVDREARNNNFGVMAHVTGNISVFYNRANNQGLGGSQRIIDINNLIGPAITAPTSKGEGQDYGFALTLLGGKINMRAAAYTSNGKDLSASYSPTGIGSDKVSASIMSTLRAAGRVTQAVADAHTTVASGVVFDMDSQGYEYSLTANPMPNWRLQATYSYTDSKRVNFGQEIKAWQAQEVAYWQSFNAGSLQTNATTTIDQAIAFMLSGFNSEANLENIGELGVRKNKVSIFTRYDFRTAVLKGIYVGGGYRHQSKNLAGSNAANTLGYFGPSFWRADLLAGYKLPKSILQPFGRFAKGLTLQLNVDNLFDDDSYLITRIQPDGVTIWRAIPQEPRTWRLQASLDF